ncbi:MAG: alpha/beta hydrolase fold domain-containing protein [Bryobacterales bacterium]|nr:alpha/beta hydrolase fold domain-containing protein [Bryobacterales bacterium]
MGVRCFPRLLAAACLLIHAAGAQPNQPAQRTALERLTPERLESTQKAREEFSRQRKALPPVGIYTDYRAVLHVHAEDAPHTMGKRAEVLAAAKLAGVRIVLFSDHNGPLPETWRGLKEGVLFLAGAEKDGSLVYPEPAPGLRFHSHVEERPGRGAEGFDGTEIYNRHADAEDDKELIAFLKALAKDPARWKEFAALVEKYPDEVFAAGVDPGALYLEHWDRILGTRHFTGVGANDAHQNTILSAPGLPKITLDPYAVSFRNLSTHILARELTPESIASSLREGRAYVSHDWLCDPTGFAFVASNNLGLYEAGDVIPIVGSTLLTVRTPLPGIIKVFRNGALLEERTTSRLELQAREPGAYRSEVWLMVDGEPRLWIYANPIYLEKAGPDVLKLPPMELSAGVSAVRDIPYTEGSPDDAEKHRLDIYRPSSPGARPVLFFIHGGAWKSGDRKLYPPLANRFAKEGYVVVLPSYRLSPKHKHPAQLEDVAAALAWTFKNIAQYGGNPQRIYVSGQSAGGHLAASLGLNPQWLAPYGIKPADIRGVLALSGVYDLTGALQVQAPNVFGEQPEILRQASPIEYAGAGAPPFLITYCQWDYAFLPQQAEALHRKLKDAGARSELIFVPRENHISEVLHIVNENDATSNAMLRSMRQAEGN